MFDMNMLLHWAAPSWNLALREEPRNSEVLFERCQMCPDFLQTFPVGKLRAREYTAQEAQNTKHV